MALEWNQKGFHARLLNHHIFMRTNSHFQICVSVSLYLNQFISVAVGGIFSITFNNALIKKKYNKLGQRFNSFKSIGAHLDNIIRKY